MDVPTSSSLGAMGPLLRKLDSLMATEDAFPGEVNKEIQLLTEDVKKINTSLVDLSDAEDPPLTAKCWMKEVRELSYDMDDYVDQIMHSGAGADAKTGTVGKSGLLKISRLQKTKVKRRPQMANKISEFRARVQDASERRERYGLESITLKHRFVSYGHRLPTLHAEPADHLVDHGPMDELVKSLSSDKEKQLKVVSIVGHGGVGKTTLAKRLYQKLGGQFECRAFIRVSLNPDIRRLLTSTFLQIQRQQPGVHGDAQDLTNNIANHLQNKRYLIVFDGVWSAQTWKYIRCAFPEDDCASRIIMTTNITDVAESCVRHSSDFIYHMRPLHPDDSYRLFRSIIFGSQRTCSVALEKIADKILEACGGVPLAIIIIAGLLASKPAQVAQWEKVVKRMDPAGKGDLTTEGMKKIFHICYSDLPRHLKSCLLYLSVFPENHVIRKDGLIWRWIAEGLIPRRGEESLWETGERYFQELVSRKLIEPAEDEWDEKPLGCKVHGLILEFITSLSNEENFVTTYEQAISLQQGVIRRLTVNYGIPFSPSTVDLSKVRSLTILGSLHVPLMGDHSLSRKHFRVGLRFLRVLDLEDAGYLGSHHLEGIEGLVLLRYFGLGGTYIDELPEKIGELQHLETLDLRRTTRLRILPASIVGLRKLVRLVLSGSVEAPEEIWKMQELEEVSTIDVGSSSSLSSVSELLIKSKRLRMLGVRWGGDSDRTTETYGRRSVKSFLDEVGKSSLQSLLLEGCPPRDLLDLLLDSWVPPHHLRRFELTISGTLHRVPRKMASLVNLTHLHIQIDCVEAEDLRVLGDLPNLVLLDLLSKYSGSERIVISMDGFRCLVVFSCTCPGATGLQFTPGAMPQLRRLRFEFYARVTRSVYEDFDFGIQHLSCLTRVHATIRWSDATDMESDAAEAAIREQVSMNPNTPVLELSRTKSAGT